MRLWQLYRQEAFLGKNRRSDYFEGWYFKLIDKSQETVLAVIPGVSFGTGGADAHAFIQVIDAMHNTTQYHRYDLERFWADTKRLHVIIGDNEFTREGIRLNLGDDTVGLSGDLRFVRIIPYPKTLCRPNIMGPFSFVPGMECYHGIVNISHAIEGTIAIDGKAVDMTNGEGYIEKDWGRSFPEAWIWMQANHFQTPQTAFLFSVARIPWRGRSFVGLIAFLYTSGKMYTFATYNKGRIVSLKLRGQTLDGLIKSPHYTLSFHAEYAKGGLLSAPKNGLMKRTIEETINAAVSVQLTDDRGNVMFSQTSLRTGMEIAGRLDEVVSYEDE